MVQALLPSEPVKTKICKSGLKVDRNSHENIPEKTKEHYWFILMCVSRQTLVSCDWYDVFHTRMYVSS